MSKSLSNYFRAKTSKEEFKTHFNRLIEECKGKRILIYGAGAAFDYFYQNYPLQELKIIAVADKRFKKETTYKEIRAINPKEILKETFDCILITDEDCEKNIKYLNKILPVENLEIKAIIQDEFETERESYIYLEKHNFLKRLAKISKELSGKSVLIYGAGFLFEAILKYYDLSGLNIVGVADKIYTEHDKDETFHGYKVYAPEEIAELNPDYTLVSIKYYFHIFYDIYKKYFRGTKIRLKPLVKKTFWELLRET